MRYTIFEREEYDELVFDEPINQEDDDAVDKANEFLMANIRDIETDKPLPLGCIDWRDDQTCWIWHKEQ